MLSISVIMPFIQRARVADDSHQRKRLLNYNFIIHMHRHYYIDITKAHLCRVFGKDTWYGRVLNPAVELYHKYLRDCSEKQLLGCLTWNLASWTRPTVVPRESFRLNETLDTVSDVTPNIDLNAKAIHFVL